MPQMESTPPVRPGLTLSVVCIGFAMVIVDTTIVNVALPAIENDLGSSLAMLQWVVDGYVLVLASLLLSGGALVDRLGSARMFRCGVALFTIASALCGLAPSGVVLVATRLLQGVAAALLMPAAMALIAEAYPEPKAKAKAVALFTTVAGSPQAFGPVLGGALVSTIGWRSIFFLNVPIGAVTMVLALRPGIPSSTTNHGHRADLPGQILTVVVMVAATGALIEAGAQGWSAPFPLAAFAVAIVSGIGLCIRERGAPAPMLPARLLTAPGLSAFVAIGLLLFAAYYGLVFTLSLYLQQVEHLGPFSAGLRFLPSALPIFVLPVFVGRLTARWGARTIACGGLLAAAGGAAALLAVHQHAGPLTLSIALALLGCGVGLTVGPQISLVIGAAPTDQTGIASGLLNAGRQAGSVLGVAVLGSLAGSGDRVTGIHTAAVAAVALLLVAAVAAAPRRATSRPTLTTHPDLSRARQS
ncbi:MFS transporter [Antrihabitans cavernicola]|uniref:MFS transporter n=1 Tax=Antrihabitans cavernicola TaxID=2495913 RepID=A0A5A7S9U8_9NOCA|nr:MFS transporter [Spelaeibacter cavernicola]KAA0021353.1 MFS transporter [Spelaeibacter cavernicola]